MPLKISIVTPSFNQAAFLEETLRSVRDQDYLNVEHVVMDGGSADGSVEIIRRHADHLAYWISEPDAGQYDAINRGFARTTGDVMAWLNSDDKYTPWALSVVGEIFEQLPEVQWITSLFQLHWDARGRAVRCKHVEGFSKRAFRRGDYIPRPGAPAARYWIQQESTFWRRSLWEKAGARIDPGLALAGDFELWAKFYQHADLHGVATPLGGFRMHGDQKTGHRMDRYVEEALTVLKRFGGKTGAGARAKARASIVPRVPKRVARAVGLRERYKVCTFRDGRWTVSTRT